MNFSICIPIYNTEKYLERCIQSVISQISLNDEIILVDDGTKDSAGTIADKYALQDSRVKVIHKENQGLFLARISAMEVAKGDYIVSLDSDDWLEKDAIRTIRNYIDNEDIDVLIFGFNVTDIDTGVIRKKNSDVENVGKDSEKLLRTFLLTNRLNNIWRKVFKRDNLRLDIMRQLPQITMTEDWIHSLYPMINANKIKCVEDRLYNYSVNLSGMSKNFDPKIYESAKMRCDLSIRLLEEGSFPVSADEIELQYMISLAKICVYTPGKISSNNSYYSLLKIVCAEENNYLLYNKARRNLPIHYRIPLKWLFEKKHRRLLIIKKIISYVRRKTAR